ncbi:hypothetical protein DM01DRAFT_1336659 [Hesseltinella vesiculosa]|uniref:Uncharacterized protein n=1 Tax=Hesseltinella vesiculosa TaxID=101127 RepID=A0A1X2GG62_9FUNG|nr:hypothetical protein DM01DRAFT_1336659 [Hesseltinella vesiculosa]
MSSLGEGMSVSLKGDLTISKYRNKMGGWSSSHKIVAKQIIMGINWKVELAAPTAQTNEMIVYTADTVLAHLQQTGQIPISKDESSSNALGFKDILQAQINSIFSQHQWPASLVMPITTALMRVNPDSPRDGLVRMNYLRKNLRKRLLCTRRKVRRVRNNG